ncbi:MAG: FecR family protein [Cyclobacteriaceae bacterium]
MTNWNEKYHQAKRTQSANSPAEDDFDLFYTLSEYDITVDVDKGWNEFESKISQPESSSHSLGYLWKVAAILVIGLGLGGLFYSSEFNLDSANQVVTTVDEIKEITLPDGSIVTLSNKSSISYNSSEFLENRSLELNGQAYFDVVKSTNSFRITTDHGNIEVLGTSFNVNAKDQLNIIVESGVVEVSNAETSIKVRQGQTGEINANGSIAVSSTTSINGLSWKTGHFSFENTELAEVIPLLEEYYNVTIVASKSLKKCKITAEFKDKTLSNVINVIGSVLNARSKISDKKVKILGKGCN